jgi:hypothetical protein
MYNQAIAPTLKAPRSHFDLSQPWCGDIDFDYLYPCMEPIEVIPGDTISLNATVFGRFNTLLYPLMDNTYLNVYWFYAPTRILWDNAKKFFGEQVNPGDSINYTLPTMAMTTTTGYAENSLPDYFNIPPGIPDETHISLPFRLYNFCWNEFFRDENLQDSVVVDTDDGPDSPTDYVLLKKNKKHDYFTSGLVNLLKDPATAQSLPLGTVAPITGLGINSPGTAASNTLYETGASSPRSATSWGIEAVSSAVSGDETHVYIEQDSSNTAYPLVQADLSNATAATIAQLRQAFAIQALLELDARAGTRYPEQLYAIYGVTYQGESYRPEFLGSQRTRIDISQVPQTSNDGTNGNVAELAAYGTFNLNGGFTKSFDEPGYIIGLICATADISYTQGLSKMWSKTDRYSLYHPLLQNIGDQPTYKREILLEDPATDTGSTGTPNNERVFNYQERYAEYKYGKKCFVGRMRPGHASTLAAWNLSEELTGPNITYDATFIQSNTPVDRVVAVTTEPDLLVDIHHNIQAARPMHMYSVPGLGNRF